MKCEINVTKYDFFSLLHFDVRDISSNDVESFRKIEGVKDGRYCFETDVPKLGEEGEMMWYPVIEIQYQVKAFDEEFVMKSIESLQQEFNEKKAQ